MLLQKMTYQLQRQKNGHEKAMNLALEKEEFAKKIIIDRLNELINETKKAAAKAKSWGGLTLDDIDTLRGTKTFAI